MQSETGFPSSHQLKSYVASKSRLKLAARCPVSGCWPSCLCKDGLVGCFLDLPFSFVRQLFMYFGQVKAFHIHFSTVQLCLPLLSPVYNSISFHLWTVWELISVFFTSRMPMGHMLVFRLLGCDFEVFCPQEWLTAMIGVRFGDLQLFQARFTLLQIITDTTI